MAEYNNETSRKLIETIFDLIAVGSIDLTSWWSHFIFHSKTSFNVAFLPPFVFQSILILKGSGNVRPTLCPAAKLLNPINKFRCHAIGVTIDWVHIVSLSEYEWLFSVEELANKAAKRRASSMPCSSSALVTLLYNWFTPQFPTVWSVGARIHNRVRCSFRWRIPGRRGIGVRTTGSIRIQSSGSHH